MPIARDRLAGLRLRDVREQCGLTRAELAGLLDVETVIVAKLETGAAAISTRRRSALAKALRVTPRALAMMPGTPVQR